MMRSIMAGIFCAALAAGCGVKAPPVAPVRYEEPEELNLDCSPHDEKCDRQDPKYRPQKK